MKKLQDEPLGLAVSQVSSLRVGPPEPHACLAQSVEAPYKGAPVSVPSRPCGGEAWLLGGAAPMQVVVISPLQNALEEPVTSSYKVISPEPDRVRVGRV